MRKSGLIVAMLALAVGCAHSDRQMHEEHEENEVRMSIGSIPDAARATIMKEAEGATVTGVDREQKHGKTIYEADAVIGGQNYEIKVDSKGTLLSKKIDNEDHEGHENKEDPDNDGD
ncbi:MAG TPA: hypothetical protein VG722_07120 [Tepidisphaeraceae bacterium]|nr:hypothetical protein [Tepidisphaeraceae bacterium]